jgi:hypothetical protein
MSKYNCPECETELLQVLVRAQRKITQREIEAYPYEDHSKHFGFWCDKCKQMYKEKWELEKYG